MSLFRRAFLLASVVVFAAIAGGVLVFGVVPSRANQNPTISLDMVPSGNTYDDSTNSMSVGAIDNCLTSAIANSATHNHASQLVIQNVEDLVAFQARLNYIGDKMRPSNFNPTPFSDTLNGGNVGFANLPLDSGSHRVVTPSQAIPAAPADGTNTAQTALVGAGYQGMQTFAASPDTPAKATPDDTSYDAPNGGILGALTLQVVGNESGDTSLFMNLDDGSPNAPGSRAVIFTGSGTQDINFTPSELGDGFHGEGVTCVPLDCTTQECPVVVDITNYTFTNDTPLASGLHARFDRAVTPRLIQNAPGCPTPVMSGDNTAGKVDLDWGTPCSDGGETVVIEITSSPKANLTCSHWSLLGLAPLKNCDASGP